MSEFFPNVSLYVRGKQNKTAMDLGIMCFDTSLIFVYFHNLMMHSAPELTIEMKVVFKELWREKKIK